MTNLALIKPDFPCDEIPATLRRIADAIEAGDYGLATTCVIGIGHTSQRPDGDGNIEQSDEFELFGCGPRCDIFTVRGLLLTLATRS